VSLLILGGTADGRQLADYFHQQGLAVIYSVAGLVRAPAVSCEVVSGGFSQFGGLAIYIKQRAVTAILDVTHPYAKTMSETAVNVAHACEIPCWRFHREPWLQDKDDDWQSFQQWSDLAPVLAAYDNVLLTCGQLDQSQVDGFTDNAEQQQWLRTAVKPKADLPASMHWIKAIGPFNLADEIKLMRDNYIDVLVSKNSGGDSTSAKLTAARELGVKVLMIARPTVIDAEHHFVSHTQCRRFILSRFANAV
jgi:precorrin-6A/cobalt-precorrin-6A reductase